VKKICLIIIGIILLHFISLASVLALNIDVNVPKKSMDVISGERFYFEITIKASENTERKDLVLDYTITTLEGILIAQHTALNVIETQASFVEFIVIPKSADSGSYILMVTVKDSEGLTKETRADFRVTKTNQIRTYMFILLGVIVAGVLIFGLILWLIRRKKKKRGG